MSEVRALAAYMLSHIEKMPDAAVLTEEELEIEEIKSFPVSQYISDMYGKLTVGYINGRLVLYRKTDKNDDAFVYARLMRLLKMKSVTVVVRAEPIYDTAEKYMKIGDFIRLCEFGTNNIPTHQADGGIYAISKGRCTPAEKRALRLLGADAVGESSLPFVLAAESIQFDGIMLFEENVEISYITGGEYESQV